MGTNLRTFYRTLAILAALTAALCEPSLAGRHTITVLSINDVYQISPVNGLGGFARVKTLVDLAKKENPNTIFTLSGDFLSPSLMSGLMKGRQMVDMLNRIGVDYVSLGNHEFDFGLDVFKERLKESKFVTITSNALENGQPFPGVLRYAIKDFGGIKVGIFGIITPWTKQIARLPDTVTFPGVIETSQKMVAELKAKGANVIIAMTHLDLADDVKLGESVAGIDLILGGHDHEPTERKAGRTLVIKCGSDAKLLGRVDISWDDAKRSASVKNVLFIPVDSTVKEDKDTAIAVSRYEKEMDERLNVVLGKTDAPLMATSLANRTQETNLGGLIADALREKSGADIGFINGGGIRSDRVYPPGPITKKDVLSILPFGNLFLKVELSGKDIKKALERGVGGLPAPKGAFPQVSGVTFEVLVSAVPGKRVRNVMVNNTPIEDGKAYTAALSDYLVAGGDGYEEFKAGRVIIGEREAGLMAEAVMEKIIKMKVVTPTAGNRIKIVQ